MNKYTTKSIADKVSRHLDIDIRSTRRKRECVYGRVIYYKLCKEYTHHTLESIGKEVNKDHASVYVGLKQFASMAFYKDNYWKAYMNIKHDFDSHALSSDYIENPDEYWKNKYFKLRRDLNLLLSEKEVPTTD